MAKRRINSPSPGHELGNVEKSLCTSQYGARVHVRENPQKGESRLTPIRLKRDDPSLQAQAHCVRSVPGAQFCQNVLDVGLRRFLIDVQMCGDRLVRIP